MPAITESYETQTIASSTRVVLAPICCRFTEVSSARLVDACDCGRGGVENSRGHNVHGVLGFAFFAGVRCKIAVVASGRAAGI